MTDTTDIKALRDEFTVDQWWYKELLEVIKQVPGNLDLRRAVIGVIPNLIGQFEAERQRAEAESVGADKCAEDCLHWMNRAKKAEAEIAALRDKYENS